MFDFPEKVSLEEKISKLKQIVVKEREKNKRIQSELDSTSVKMKELENFFSLLTNLFLPDFSVNKLNEINILRPILNNYISHAVSEHFFLSFESFYKILMDKIKPFNDAIHFCELSENENFQNIIEEMRQVTRTVELERDALQQELKDLDCRNKEREALLSEELLEKSKYFCPNHECKDNSNNDDSGNFKQDYLISENLRLNDEIFVLKTSLVEMEQKSQLQEHTFLEKNKNLNEELQSTMKKLSYLDELKVSLEEKSSLVISLKNDIQNMQKSNMPAISDLEFQDLEKSILCLSQQLKDEQNQCQNLKSVIEVKTNELNNLKDSNLKVIESYNETLCKNQSLNQELHLTKEEISRLSEELCNINSAHDLIKSQLNEHLDLHEKDKFEMSENSQTITSLMEKIKLSENNLVLQEESFHSRLRLMKNENQTLRENLQNIESDYNNYKIKAQNQLRELSINQTDSDGKQFSKSIINKPFTILPNVDTLISQNEELIEKLTLKSSKFEDLERENLCLIDRCNLAYEEIQNLKLNLQQSEQERINMLESINAEWKTKFEVSQAEANTLMAVKISEIERSNLAKFDQSNFNYELKIKELQNELERLELSHSQLFNKLSEAIPSESSKSLCPNCSYASKNKNEEREQGEGMEAPTMKSHSDSMYSYDPKYMMNNNDFREPISLENLLNASSYVSMLPSANIEIDNSFNLQSIINELQKKILILTENLCDSENTVLQLTEQSKILKEEIRRIERNGERDKRFSASSVDCPPEQHKAQTLEYFKNIMMKFVTSAPGEDRRQLVPVMNTILALNQEELALLNRVAIGQPSQFTSQNSTPWSNYFHWRPS